MLTQQSIRDFLAQSDYDIRESGNGRWIDQKCTPDVVTVIADFIFDYVSSHPDCAFSSADIWNLDYASQTIEAVFKKPGTKNKFAKNEYNKFFQQPMEMFANAKILLKTKQGRRNIYQVNRLDILEYIALRERNALTFLKLYIEKVLHDSELSQDFDRFFQAPSKSSYRAIKSTFYAFTIQYTKINKDLECGRIFTKVINPLAYFYNTCGTDRGNLSKAPITYDMLMYNRPNFRDIYADKPKGVTRKEYAATHPIEINEDYYRYQSNKATRFLRIFNDQTRNGQTEHLEPAHLLDKATHMHHIFPKSLYPEISFYLENIIALTPTQHLITPTPMAARRRSTSSISICCCSPKQTVSGRTFLLQTSSTFMSSVICCSCSPPALKRIPRFPLPIWISAPLSMPSTGITLKEPQMQKEHAFACSFLLCSFLLFHIPGRQPVQ